MRVCVFLGQCVPARCPRCCRRCALARPVIAFTAAVSWSADSGKAAECCTRLWICAAQRWPNTCPALSAAPPRPGKRRACRRFPQPRSSRQGLLRAWMSTSMPAVHVLMVDVELQWFPGDVASILFIQFDGQGIHALQAGNRRVEEGVVVFRDRRARPGRAVASRRAGRRGRPADYAGSRATRCGLCAFPRRSPDRPDWSRNQGFERRENGHWYPLRNTLETSSCVVR